MNSNYERRDFFKRSFAPTIGTDNRLSGQGAPFDSTAVIGGAFREQIAPTAFNKTVRDGNMVLLDSHDPAKPLARQSAGTLQVNTDARGLQWSARPSDTSYARDVLTNVRSGNYGGCSIFFSVPKGGDSWDKTPADGGLPQRTLHEVNVREISIVTFPAYTDTNVANRTLELAFSEHDAYRDDAPPKPYGDVKYADPKNGKYPLDTKKHVISAWAFVNMADHASNYPLNGVTLSSVKNNIIAAAKQFGINIANGGGAVSGRSYDDDYEQWAQDAQESWRRHALANHARTGREIAMDAAIHGRVTDPAAHAHRARIMREARNLSVQDDNPYEWRPMPYGKRGW